MTPGFALRARHVIHTVGPIWRGGNSGEEKLLASCYQSALTLACEHGLHSIAFPAISCGVYGFPPGKAAKIVHDTLAAVLAETSSLEVTLVAMESNVHAALLSEFDETST